jgi:hypothetical protein
MEGVAACCCAFTLEQIKLDRNLGKINVGGFLQSGGGVHPPNPSLGRVWGKSRNAQYKDE